MIRKDEILPYRKAEMSGKDQMIQSAKIGVVGYKVAEVAGMLRISENATRDLIARGELEFVRVGRLLRIPPRQFHAKYGEALCLSPSTTATIAKREPKRTPKKETAALRRGGR